MPEQNTQFWAPTSEPDKLVAQAQQAMILAYKHAKAVDGLNDDEATLQAANYCAALACQAYMAQFCDYISQQNELLASLIHEVLSRV